MKRVLTWVLVGAILALPLAALAKWTVTQRQETREGNHKAVYCYIIGDSSYDTGGDTLALADVGLTSIYFVDASPCSVTTIYDWFYDYTNDKFGLLTDLATSVLDSLFGGVETATIYIPQSANEELTATTTAAAVKFRLRVLGN